ncbi:ATP-binding protein [Hydrogenophaga sp. 5NK40-0174]|uniref:sensor histidine kinase n=1 Tax=Hydrogenophaga sp. 5NK40-0174 TaxID=3127649 RepID=UPI003104D21D
MRWTQSLFARVFLLQVAVAVVLAVLLALVFLVGQPRVIARSIAPVWAEQLRASAMAMEHGVAPGTEVKASVHTSVTSFAGPPPADARYLPRRPLAPRYRVVLRALREEGVIVQQIALSNGGEDGITWLQVSLPGQQQPQWVGIDGALEDPTVRWRSWLVMGVAVCVFLLAAAWLSRRVVRPLTELQSAMAQYAATGQEPDGVSPSAPSEVRALSDQFGRFARERNERDAERDTMLAGLSHDLRTPLGRIRMAAALLPDTPEVNKRRESIERNAGIADAMVESFLALNRSAVEPLDTRVYLPDLLKQLRESGDHDDVQWHVDDGVERWLAPASESGLERALVNLLDNARKYGRAPIEVTLRQDVKSVWLSVRDHGSGIPAGQRERLLKPFYRGASDRGLPGSGLGLAMVERVARRHGASLELDDAEPGLRVSMRWPVADLVDEARRSA